jgi:hypothetical protein
MPETSRRHNSMLATESSHQRRSHQDVQVFHLGAIVGQTNVLLILLNQQLSCALFEAGDVILLLLLPAMSSCADVASQTKSYRMSCTSGMNKSGFGAVTLGARWLDITTSMMAGKQGPHLSKIKDIKYKL